MSSGAPGYLRPVSSTVSFKKGQTQNLQNCVHAVIQGLNCLIQFATEGIGGIKDVRKRLPAIK